MAQPARPFLSRRRQSAALEAERRVCDSDLIESYVFEIKALQSRYDYLLRRVKELECAP